MRRRAVALTVSMLVLSATACSSSENDVGIPEDLVTAFHQELEYQIESARSSGDASPRQLEILERARDSDAFTQGLAREGLLNYFVCLSDLGIPYNDLGATGQKEFARLEYSTGAGSFDDQADSCYTTEFVYIDSLYQTQPAAEAENRAITHAAFPAIHQCLRDAGHVFPDDVTYDETMALVIYASFGDWMFHEPVSAVSLGQPADCVEGAGLDHDDVAWSEQSGSRR